MGLKQIASGCLAASMILGPVGQAQADGDALIGGIVGGIIGGAIVNEGNRQRQQQRVYTTPRVTQSSAQREANREVQTALNYFGYPVGAPDGSIGPRSRSAISQYQATLGYPATGQLTEYERTVLVSSYQRAMVGGPVVAQTIATHPMGVRGLLIAQRDEMAGIPPAGAYTAAAPPVAPAPAPVAEPAAPTLPLLAAEPEPKPEAAPALPSFLGDGATMVSLASQCNKISLMTNTNGGYTTAAAMTDANFALGEQFCLARTYAMATGEELAAKIAGFTPQQIADQCKGFGPVLQEHVQALSLKPAADVINGVSGFVLTSGMAPAQLAGTAKICLGVGYTTDAMDVAIGSALMLTSLGEKGYAELLGHHLSQGFGASVRPDLALEWYEMGLAADAAGGGVFAPGLPDRTELIRKAAYTLGGRADLLEPAPALPVFAPVEVAPAEAAPAAAPVTAPATKSGEKGAALAPSEVAPAAAQDMAEVPATDPAAPVAALPVTSGQVLSAAARLPLLLVGQ